LPQAARPAVAARRALLVTLGLAFGVPGALRPAAAAGIEPTATVGGSTLPLHGRGLRTRFGFKVYEMALYTAQKAASPEALLALPGPKRLFFIAQRELPGTELGRLFLRGMSDNASPQQMNRHTLASTRLIDVFSGRAKMMPGETFAMDFEPGKGTTFYIQGQAQGAPVGDDEFFRLVLGIWFGKDPVDSGLRDALLGRGRD
jgi:hypothetical protein